MTRPAPTVTVPVEPTEAMKIAGVHAIDNVQPNDVSMWVTACWSAMITAAPAAPQAAEVGGDWMTLADLHTIKGWLHGLSTAPDLTGVVADGGVSAGDVYQQEAREFAGRLSRIIEAMPAFFAPSREPEGGAVSDAAWDVVRRVSKLTVAGGDPMQDPAFAQYPAIADLVAKAQAAIATREEAPAEAGEGAKALEKIVECAVLRAGNRVIGIKDIHQRSVIAGEEIDAAVKAIRALHAQPQAREDAQPYGWIYERFDVGSGWCAPNEWHPAQFTRTPPKPETSRNVITLYTHPAPDALRVAETKAVEAMRGAIEWDKARGYRMPYRVRDPLYAALAALQAEQGAK